MDKPLNPHFFGATDNYVDEGLSIMSGFVVTLHTITQLVHPFHPVSQAWQLWSALSSTLDAPLEVLSTLASTYASAKAHSAIATFKAQIPSLAQGIHAWWQWVAQALSAQTDDPQVLFGGAHSFTALGVLAATSR